MNKNGNIVVDAIYNKKDILGKTSLVIFPFNQIISRYYLWKTFGYKW